MGGWLLRLKPDFPPSATPAAPLARCGFQPCGPAEAIDLLNASADDGRLSDRAKNTLALHELLAEMRWAMNAHQANRERPDLMWVYVG